MSNVRAVVALMFHLIYVSSTQGLLTKEQLLGILRQSRINNAASGITGLLLYWDGNVMQVLEGEESAVRATFSRIARDPRHSGLIVLTQGAVEQREFPSWQMDFRDLDAEDMASIPGYSSFVHTPLTAEIGGSRAQKLLRLFRERM